MIGRYWSPGISLRFSRITPKGHGWWGSVPFQDEGFGIHDPDAGQVSTVGLLHTRNAVGEDNLGTLTTTLRDEAARLGIGFRDPALFFVGEEPENPLGLRQLEAIRREAARIGWDAPFGLGGNEEPLP